MLPDCPGRGWRIAAQRGKFTDAVSQRPRCPCHRVEFSPPVALIERVVGATAANDVTDGVGIRVAEASTMQNVVTHNVISVVAALCIAAPGCTFVGASIGGFSAKAHNARIEADTPRPSSTPDTSASQPPLHNRKQTPKASVGGRIVVGGLLGLGIDAIVVSYVLKSLLKGFGNGMDHDPD